MLILAKDSRIPSNERVKSLKSSNSFETNFWICADGKKIMISKIMKGFENHRISRQYFTKLCFISSWYYWSLWYKMWNIWKQVFEFCDYSNSNVKCGRSKLEVDFIWGLPIPRQKITWDSMNDIARDGSCSIPKWVSPKRDFEVFDPAWLVIYTYKLWP